MDYIFPIIMILLVVFTVRFLFFFLHDWDEVWPLERTAILETRTLSASVIVGELIHTTVFSVMKTVQKYSTHIH